MTHIYVKDDGVHFNGFWLLQVDNGCKLFEGSLVVLWLYFGQFTISSGHCVGKKLSAELCTRLCTFSLPEQTFAEEMRSQLEASWGILGFHIVHLST